MEYPPPIYLIMLSLFAGHISLDEALRMMDLREQEEQEEQYDLCDKCAQFIEDTIKIGRPTEKQMEVTKWE